MPFEKEKNPLIKRETLKLFRAYDMIDEERVRNPSLRRLRLWGVRSRHAYGGPPQTIAYTDQMPALLGLLPLMHANRCNRFCAEAFRGFGGVCSAPSPTL
jgi:hypothetical protein